MNKKLIALSFHFSEKNYKILVVTMTSMDRWFYGDPHIESLDGKQYTFNGLGEYVLMKIVNENVTFELQARTERILKENGTYNNATVFTAFALKEGNTTFQDYLKKSPLFFFINLLKFIIIHKQKGL
ncbi:hypothetical protein KUTeg_015419 [Tegillarca granosa]|uniref:VWFD domain-containing protein n=1 Tax=Tegillarca granosa TaxID=220873 RepID=A0ABQ9EVA9_TEGGR|nr:hypothetical protein KUTeg_015419 [Tegillarca granosa]